MTTGADHFQIIYAMIDAALPEDTFRPREHDMVMALPAGVLGTAARLIHEGLYAEAQDLILVGSAYMQKFTIEYVSSRKEAIEFAAKQTKAVRIEKVGSPHRRTRARCRARSSWISA